MTIPVHASPTIAEYAIPQTIQGDNFVSALPHVITASADGTLWFTESGGNNISQITQSGDITQYPIPTQNSQVYGLTNGPNGDHWFTEPRTNKIGNSDDFGNITEYPANQPWDITSGPDGALWFTERGPASTQVGPNMIGRITASGAVTQFSIPTTNSWPEGITSGPDGALWFTETLGNKIGRITTSGNFTEYQIPTTNSMPYNITSGPDGALWFAEEGADKIGRITTSGNFTEFQLPSNNEGVYSIVTGLDGALWYTAGGANKIGRISTSGDITEYAVTTSNSIPNGITVGPDGALWFTEVTGNKIGQLTPGLGHGLVQAINAGGNTAGNYNADTNFTGGQTYSSSDTVDTSSVNNPAPQSVYQSVRYGNNMSYTFSGLTPNADYSLRLHFNELYWGTDNAGGNGGVGSRVFNVDVNGNPALSNFDIYSAAGGADKAIVKQVHTTADASGNVTVNFTSVTDNAMINGLELYTGTLPPEPTPPTVTSAQINAGGNASGSFVPDTDFNGGTLFSSNESVDTSNVTSPAPPAVYQSARYGNFTYTIPNLTPNTTFNVRLHFNELYWGTDLAGGNGGVGSRLFNVDINGNQVLNNFDIYQAAGGANKAITEEFNAQSDANGHINIQFTTVTDNAMVSGIDVEQQ